MSSMLGKRPVFQGGGSSRRKIVICIDGTGNEPNDAHEREVDTTNVWRLFQALIQNDDQQLCHYIPGVATSGSKVVNSLAWLTGAGADRKSAQALEYLNNVYQSGDSIYLFGFSRGAAICRDLANQIGECFLMGAPNIPLIGLWDTVGAFGIPMDLVGIKFQELNLGKQLDIPSFVQKTVHLLALHETRSTFTPTLVEAGDDVEEVWFVGAHADVGGGFRDRELANITLRYMIKQAINAGLRFDPEVVKAIPINERCEGKIHVAEGKFDHAPRQIVVRKNGAESALRPKIHRSVFQRHPSPGDPQLNLHNLGGKFDVVD